MKREELYQIWAPDDAPWSAWAKPVLFATMPQYLLKLNNAPTLPTIDWHPQPDGSTAIIIDQPGEIAALSGVTLAHKGFCPVPLFNGCMAPAMIIDMLPVATALVETAQALLDLHVSTAAPPVFLLDSRRLSNQRMSNPGKYDNRWTIIAQDMPSAQRLKDAGITTVVVRTDTIAEDLAHILRRYQDEHLTLKICNPSSDKITDLDVVKPKWYKEFFYRLNVLSGFYRNAAGGFGGIVPTPSASGGG